VTGTASPGDPLGPLRAQSTPALIADLLRAEVLAGTFPPHSQLSEAHLARPVLPAAMLQLQRLLDRLAASAGGPWTEVITHDLAFHQALVDAAAARLAVPERVPLSD
jgi:DNA-binding GntR family transcriptional regulator